MTQPPASFAYDVVLSLNSSVRLRECLPAIETFAGTKKIIASILNHRFYNLHEKNFIKGTLEAHNLDHIMFSMRPSSQKFLSETDGEFIEKFKDLSHVFLALQMMARHKIPMAIVEGKYLEMGEKQSTTVGNLEKTLLKFLNEVTTRLSHVKNIKKQFPWLFSIEKLLPEIRNNEIFFLTKFSPEPTHLSKYEYDDNQITNLEKDLYWIGFDASFKQPPLDKPFPKTKWTELAKNSEPGKGLFEDRVQYCTRCCLPATMEGISFDEVGVCVPCQSSEEKMHINWEKRKEGLQAIIDSYRSDSYYDCMLPMSGGKDSTYQAHILHKIYKVTPLAVTHGQSWLSLAGRYNVENCLQKFDLDHITFIMNRAVINKMARKSLAAIGDVCWHCHIGAGAFPIIIALAWNMGLMIWGESLAESDGRGSYNSQGPVASHYYNLEISARVKAEDMSDENTSNKDLSAWIYPSKDKLKNSDIKYLHLGNYFFWDEERQVEFIKRNYEWMESPVENTFKGFKSVECTMSGVHDYSNFLKRGVGRATIQASTDVKRGLITREEGFALAKEYDTQRPHALDYYLKITGFTEEEFEQIIKEAREKSTYAMKLGDL